MLSRGRERPQRILSMLMYGLAVKIKIGLRYTKGYGVMNMECSPRLGKPWREGRRNVAMLLWSSAGNWTKAAIPHHPDSCVYFQVAGRPTHGREVFRKSKCSNGRPPGTTQVLRLLCDIVWGDILLSHSLWWWVEGGLWCAHNTIYNLCQRVVLRIRHP